MKNNELIFYLVKKDFILSINGLIPYDESMVNRGRSMFDAISFFNGKFIDIDSHLSRTYNGALMIGAPINSIFSKKELKSKIENLKNIITKKFGKNIFLKLEIIITKQLNIILRVIPLPQDWLDSKKSLVLMAINHKYLLQDLKYSGRYAEPMILSDIGKKQIDSDIDECLFYSTIGNSKNIALEATNSSFFVIDTKNRLWVSKPPNVLLSTSSKFIEKVAKINMNDKNLPKAERISSIMKSGFPFNKSGYKIKEMFSSGAVRSLVKVRKLIFVENTNDKSVTGLILSKKIKTINSYENTPITDYLKNSFKKEIYTFLNQK